MRLILLTILALAAAPAAQAASFDCDKAETPLEQAICGSEALSRSDEVLAKSYATALGGLSGEARALVQQSQRDWLRFVGLSCTDDAQPVTDAYSDDQISCLDTGFRNRSRDLEQSRMNNGWRFYPIDRFAVLDDPDEGEWWGTVATKQLSSVRIDDEVPAALAFNALMDEVDFAPGQPFDADGTLREDDVSSDLLIRTTVQTVNTSRISLEVLSYWMGHGAAHGNYAITYRHFFVDDERWLDASDVFAAPGWEEALTALVLDELDRTIEGGIWPEARDDLGATVADPEKWRFDDAGLVVQFQPYEITAYAYGAPTASIPWSALTDYLAEGWESRLLY